MDKAKNLFSRYESFVLSKIPHHLKKSNLFFVGLMLLALPVTVVLAMTQQDIRQRASEFATPPIPSNPVISGYVFMDSNANGNREDLEVGIPYAQIAIYRTDGCPYEPMVTTPTPCPTPALNLAVTDAAGKYSFGTAPSGSYSVRFNGSNQTNTLTSTTPLYATALVPPDQTINFGFTDKPLVSPTPAPTIPQPTVGPVSVMLKTQSGYFYADSMYITLDGQSIKIPEVTVGGMKATNNIASIQGKWVNDSGTFILSLYYDSNGSTWALNNIAVQKVTHITGAVTNYYINPTNTITNGVLKADINQEAKSQYVEWRESTGSPKATINLSNVRTQPFFTASQGSPTPTPTYSVTPTTANPSPMPTYSMSPTPQPTPSCIQAKLSSIDLDRKCSSFTFIPPFRKSGHSTASFQCTDGYKGSVGNSKTCYSDSTLNDLAKKQCSTRCVAPPKPSFSPADLNLDGYVNKTDYNILVNCMSKRTKCEAKQNPDLNNDKLVNAQDLNILQAIISKR